MSLQRLAVPVQDSWVRVQPQEWLDIVSWVLDGDPKRLARLEAISSCGHEYVWWQCPNSHEVFAPRGCRDPLCYFCQRGYAMKRTKEIMIVLDRVYELLHDKMSAIGLEFTEPLDIQKRMSPKDLKYMRDCAVGILKELFGGERIPGKDKKDSKRFQLLSGGIVVAQWWGSFKECGPDGLALRGRPVKTLGNVWKRFEPHIHAVVFDRVWNNLASRLTDGGVVEFGGAFEKRGVTFSRKEHESLRLRAAGMWRAKMEARFGKSSFRPETRKAGPKGQASSWDVHFEPIQGRHDMEDRIFYMIRGIVQDSYREATVNHNAPLASQRPHVKQMLLAHEKYSKSYVGFGWFADSVINRYANTLLGACPTVGCGHAVHKGECRATFERPGVVYDGAAFCGNQSCRHKFHDGPCGLPIGHLVRSPSESDKFSRSHVFRRTDSPLFCSCSSSIQYIGTYKRNVAPFVERCHCQGTAAIAPARRRRKELDREFCGECGEEMEKRGVVSRDFVLSRNGMVLHYVRLKPVRVVQR